MFIAIKGDIAIAVNQTGEFPCLVYDEIQEIGFAELYNGVVYTSEEELAKVKDEQGKAERIAKLERLLASKDYIGVKIATGCATVEDYAEEIAQCEEWRKEIRELKK